MSKLTRIKMFDKTAEDDFEQKLAQMADAEISQSMPSLTPYKVGFQVIDKNEDETRGAGVMVYKFKEQWGAQPHPLFWQYALRPGESLPELNPDNPKYALAIRVWQRLPLWITRFIGPSIVRNIP